MHGAAYFGFFRNAAKVMFFNELGLPSVLFLRVTEYMFDIFPHTSTYISNIILIIAVKMKDEKV